MRIEILHEAEEELSHAVAHYEEIEPGLDLRLKEEVRAVIQWIGDNPELPRLRPKGYRRVNLKVFRYYYRTSSGMTRYGYWQWPTVCDAPIIGFKGRKALAKYP